MNTDDSVTIDDPEEAAWVARQRELVEHLPPDQQPDLIDVMRRRLAERARQRIAADAREARAEHAAGKTRAVSVDDLMREIES